MRRSFFGGAAEIELDDAVQSYQTAPGSAPLDSSQFMEGNGYVATACTLANRLGVMTFQSKRNRLAAAA